MLEIDFCEAIHVVVGDVVMTESHSRHERPSVEVVYGIVGVGNRRLVRRRYLRYAFVLQHDDHIVTGLIDAIDESCTAQKCLCHRVVPALNIGCIV